MMRILLAASIMLGTLLVPLAASAQVPDIQARVEIDRPEATLGDRIRLTVSVQHPDSVLVDVEPPADSGALRVVEKPPPTTQPGVNGGPSLTRFEFVVATFGLGQQQAPPLRMTWLEEDGNSGDSEIAVPPFNVRSTVAADDTALRPLKPQRSIEGAPTAWEGPAAIGAGLVVLLALAAVTFWWRRRGRTAPEAAPAFVALAEDEARRLLEEMVLADPLARGDYDTYYGTISIVIRGYLQERFRFGATALTTRELEQRMTRQGVERWQARLVGGLLDRCDGAIYARRRPDPASADHDLTVAFEIIELSRPKPEPASVEVAV